MSRHLCGLYALLFAAALGMPLNAEPNEKPGPEKPAAEAPSSEQIDGWIADLDSEKFSARDEASQKLAAAGTTAIDPIAKAALSDSPEVATRSLDILGKLLKSEQAGTRDKARDALQRLAKGDASSLAKRAEAMLKPEPQLVPSHPGAILVPGGAIRFGGAFRVGGAGTIRVSTKEVDGTRTTSVNENGKQIEIKEDAAGIDMSVTEKVDGKEKVAKYAAKTAEQLKKDHPEAEKLYQQYGARAGAAGIHLIVGGVVPAVPGPGGPPAGGFGPIPLAPPGVAPSLSPGTGLPPSASASRRAAEEIGHARKLLAASIDRLKKAGDDKQPALDLETRRALLESLENAERKLNEAQGRLEK